MPFAGHDDRRFVGWAKRSVPTIGAEPKQTVGTAQAPLPTLLVCHHPKANLEIPGSMLRIAPE